MNGTGRLLIVLLVLGTLAWWSQPGAAQPGGMAPALASQVSPAGAGLVSHVVSQPGRPHTVIVTDPVNSVLAVYHVDPASGGMTLKSVRNVSWDLKMLQFNSEEPSPQEVRAGLPR